MDLTRTLAYGSRVAACSIGFRRLLRTAWTTLTRLACAGRAEASTSWMANSPPRQKPARVKILFDILINLSVSGPGRPAARSRGVS